MENLKIQPAKEKKIKNINKEDFKLALSGIVINKEDNSFVLDDGTGQVSVFLENNNVKNSDYIRVFGNLINFENGIELQAEFIQDLNKIDKKLHQKILDLLE